MKQGVIFLIIATMLWGGNYVCGRFLADAIPPTLLNTVRWAISTLLLWGLLAVNKKAFPLLKQWKEFMVLGFFGIFAFSTLTYLGLQYVSASLAGMISAGIPVAILLLTPLFLPEKISAKAWIGTIISVIGVVIIFQGSQGGASQSSLIGPVIIVLAGLAWGMYTVLGRKFGKHTDPLTLTAGASFYGTIFSAVSCIGTVDPNSIHIDTVAVLCIIYVSTFASVAAYLAWNAGVRAVGPGVAAPFINLLPVWTVVLGLLLLDEQLFFMSVIGGILTITGAILSSYKGTEKKVEHNIAK